MKFFDIENNKYLDFDESDVSNHDGCVKVKSKYYKTLYDIKEKTHYIFAMAKAQKDLPKTLNKENEYVIKVALDNAEYQDTYGVRKPIECPTKYSIEIGEECICGNLRKCTVIGKSQSGYYYLKHYAPMWEVKKNPDIADVPNYSVHHWHSVYPIIEKPYHIDTEESNVFYSNTTISDLLLKVHHFGVDFNPEYQRGDVWNEEQKVKLIDSIYRNINIGSFAFVEKNWHSKGNVVAEMYEILDGKQRLTAIVDYTSSKFPYKGAYYHELDNITRNRFEGYQVLVGMMHLNKENEYNKKKVIEQFIRLNECGTTMEKGVIEKAKKLIGDN